MDQCKHTARAKGSAPHRTQNTRIGQLLAFAGQRGDQTAIAGSVVNPDANSVVTNVKAEHISPLDRLERGDVKNLGRGQMIIGRDGTHVIMVAQITMPVAKRIADLCDNQDQGILRITAEPETNRVKHMPQYTGLCQQLNPRHAFDAILREHISHPNSTGPCTRRATVIAVLQRCQTSGIAAKQTRRFNLGLRIA